MPTRGSIAHAILAIVLLISVMKTSDSSAQLPVGTEFTYQGRLDFNGTPANGQFDLQFDLFGQAGFGTQLGGNQLVNVPVSEGLFTVTLDFGAAFSGERRWLQISVRPAGASETFTQLNPRTEITPSPHAINAQSANSLGGSVNTSTSDEGEGLFSINTSNNLPAVIESASNSTGGALSIYSPQSILSLHAVVDLFAGSNGAGLLFLLGPDLEPNVIAGSFSGFPNEGIVAVQGEGGSSRASMLIGAQGEGLVVLRGPNGEANVVIGAASSNPNHGLVSVLDAAGNVQAQVGIDSSGQGIVVADVKSFVVDHPIRADSKIVYISLEGPEAAMFYRGKVQLVEGRATIRLPEHFAVLASPGSLSVQLTPGSFDSQGVAVGSIGADEIEIGELGGGKGAYDVHFTVMATRKGYEDHEPVISKQEFTERFAPDIAPMKDIGLRVSSELSEKMKERLRATTRGQDLREKRSQ